MPNMNMNNNNRKSPIKSQRIKHSHSIPVANANNNNNNAGRMRSTSSMAASYPRMYNNNNSTSHHHYGYHHYSNTTSPTAMSASSLPAVPLFYSNTYADPPECSSLPQPPESWFMPSTNVDQTAPVHSAIRTDVDLEKNGSKKEAEISSTTTTPMKKNSAGFSSSYQASKVPTIPTRQCYYNHHNQGFYSPYYSPSTSNNNSGNLTASYQKFPTSYISVKA